MTKSRFGGIPVDDTGGRFGGVPVEDPVTIAPEVATPAAPMVPARETNVTQESGLFSGAPTSALPMGLQELAVQGGAPAGDEEIINNAAKEIFGIKGDISGSVAGGITGFRAGSRAGTVGGALGAMLGSIIGATGGKEIDQNLFETQDEQTLQKNVLDSTAEEFMGRLIGKVGKPIIRFADRKLAEMSGGMTGLTGTPKTIDDLYLRDESGRTVMQAEQDLLGGSRTTTFEATGGRAGAQQQAALNAASVSAAKNAVSESAALENRREVYQQIKKKLEADSTPENLAQGVKGALNFAKTSFDNKLDNIKTVLIPARTKVTVPIPDAGIQLNSIRSQVFQELGAKDGQKLLSIAEHHMTAPTTTKGVREFKENMTLADIAAMKGDIESAIGKFNPNANVQKKIAGVYGSTLRPIIDGFVNQAKEQSTGNVRKVFDLQDQFDAVAAARGGLLQSRIARRIGATGVAQTGKAVKFERIEDVVFESPQTWKEAQDLFDGIGQSGVIGSLQDRFKQRVIDNVFDLKGEASVKQIDSFIAKHGDQVIKDVAGEDYLKALKDTRLIATALDTTRSINTLKPPEMSNEQWNAVKQVAFKPLMRNVGMYTLFTTGLKNTFGIQADEKAMLKAFSGDKGKLLVERMMNKPLTDPSSYNLYVQAVREINKVSDEDKDIEILSRGEYIDNTYNSMLGLTKAFNE